MLIAIISRITCETIVAAHITHVFM